MINYIASPARRDPTIALGGMSITSVSDLGLLRTDTVKKNFHSAKK